MTHDFAFSGLIACGRCGYSVVGEIKKQKYIYYHCTGYADKCRGEPASCRRKYVREALYASHADVLGSRELDSHHQIFPPSHGQEGTQHLIRVSRQRNQMRPTRRVIV